VLVSFAQTSLTDVLRDHQEITVGVLDKDLSLTGFAVACFAPDLARTQVDRPILGNETGQKRLDILEVNLKHRALPKRRLHGACLESAMPLAEHDLLAFGMLQVNELFFSAAVSNFKADDIPPEGEAGVQVCDMKLRHDFGPTRRRRSVPIGTHIIFLSGD